MALCYVLHLVKLLLFINIFCCMDCNKIPDALWRFFQASIRLETKSRRILPLAWVTKYDRTSFPSSYLSFFVFFLLLFLVSSWVDPFATAQRERERERERERVHQIKDQLNWVFGDTRDTRLVSTSLPSQICWLDPSLPPILCQSFHIT